MNQRDGHSLLLAYRLVLDTIKHWVHLLGFPGKAAMVHERVGRQRQKDNADKQKIRSAITSVAKKQINAIKQWEEQHPGWQTTDKGTKEYCEMVQQVTTPTNDEKDNRIIKSIASGVVLEKDM